LNKFELNQLEASSLFKSKNNKANIEKNIKANIDYNLAKS